MSYVVIQLQPGDRGEWESVASVHGPYDTEDEAYDSLEQPDDSRLYAPRADPYVVVMALSNHGEGPVMVAQGPALKYTEGPILCRVERTYVDNELVRVTLEPIAREDVVELGVATEFVTVMSQVPLAPLSVWPSQV